MTETPLAAPLDLPCGTRLANRIGRSAMTEALATHDDAPTKAHQTLYKRWSEGGLALQMTGNVMVDRRFLERPGNVVVDDERDLKALAEWARAGKSGGSQIWMQISHAGRQCSIVVNTHPFSPSEEKLQMLGLFGKPRQMTGEDIRDAIARYANTARIAKKAGFDGVQIHGAHGYLVSQFLSPTTNRRTDEWGGSLENRARFLREIYAATRTAVGDEFPVAVKLNSSDFQKGGFSIADCVQVARWLEADGIDLIELSGGTYERMSFVTGQEEAGQERQSTKVREAYFLEYAREVRKAVKVPLMVTGGFRNRTAMERALSEDGIDMIGLARPTCIYPDVATLLLAGQVETISYDEAGLTIGRGRLGLNTRSWFANLVNSVSRVEFCIRQMKRMSEGHSPQVDTRANALATFIVYLTQTTARAIRRKLVRNPNAA